MPFTGAMRAWALGQVVLVVDVAAAAGLGLAQRSPGSGAAAPLVVLAGALVFFVPLVLALSLRTIRTRAAFWAVSVVPAIVWVPAIPAAFLRGGPALATPGGLTLAALAIAGAVLVTVGGALATIEAAAAGPADAADAATADAGAATGPIVEAADPLEATEEPVEAADDTVGRDAAAAADEPAAAEPVEAANVDQDSAEADARAADDELVADLVREPADDGPGAVDQTPDGDAAKDA